MRGLMQDRPLALPHVFHRAEQLFGHKPIVTATADGEVATTIAEWAVRVRRLATALDSLGVPADGRVGTFMWNTASHLELYLAAPCTGRVLHTLNIRLFPEQQVYIANHAEDDVVFVDRSLLPVFTPLRPTTAHRPARHRDRRRQRLPGPRRRDATTRRCSRRPSRSTAGSRSTTRQRRSDVLHVRHHRQPEGRGLQPPVDAAALADRADGGRAGLSERDVLMPVVPMFHVNAWGLPYAGAAGRVEHGVPRPEHDPTGDTRAAGAPPGHRHRGRADDLAGRAALAEGYDLSAVQRILCGGSAVPRSLSEAYREGVACRSCTPGG